MQEARGTTQARWVSAALGQAGGAWVQPLCWPVRRGQGSPCRPAVAFLRAFWGDRMGHCVSGRALKPLAKSGIRAEGDGATLGAECPGDDGPMVGVLGEKEGKVRGRKLGINMCESVVLTPAKEETSVLETDRAEFIVVS